GSGPPTAIPLAITAAATADNDSSDDLVADLNAAIARAGFGGSLFAEANGDRLAFGTPRALPIPFAGAGPTQLGLPNGHTGAAAAGAYTLERIEDLARVVGLTLAGAGDEDWFRIDLPGSPAVLSGVSDARVTSATLGSFTFAFTLRIGDGAAIPISLGPFTLGP